MKKVLCFLLVVVFMMSLATVALASEGTADQNYTKIEKQVESTNFIISKMVAKAIADADRLINQYQEKVLALENDKNYDEKLERLTQKLEEDIDKIIEKLVEQTNKIANRVIEAGEKEGIIVECSIIEVEIGGETVFIDPLRIRRY